jgi:cell division protein FtsB
MASRAAAAPRYRVRPRSSAGRRRGTRIKWDKLGRVLLVLVLAAILASYIGPLMSLVGAWQDRRSAASDLAALRQENANLKARASATNGPDPAAAAARRLGMIGPGDRAYYVKGLPHR